MAQLSDTISKPMDRTDIYLQIVIAQPWLLAPMIGAIFIFALIPKEKQLFVALMMVTPWLQMGRSQDLSLIAAGAKLTSGLVFALVAYAALTHPGPKRQMPFVVWIYPAMAFVWIFLILGVTEQSVGIVLRVQWFVISVAAVLLVRTVVNFDDFMRIITAFTIGCMIALMVPISALALFPGESFLRGIGRFQPYGSNSNQVGMLLALSTPLLGYAMLTWKSKFKVALALMLALTIGMALLTASRQTNLAILIVMMPIALALSKRPFVTMFGLVIAAIGIGWVMSIGGEIAPMERMASLETGRLQLWTHYITDVFSQRPLTGLLGTGDESYFRSNIIGQHPHSAWMNMMYHGGLMLFLPMFSLVIYSSYSAFRVWKERHYINCDPLLFNIMMMLLFAMYIQGCFNQVVYWPTYSWSFMHVVIATFFICIWQDIRDGNIEAVLKSDEDLYYEYLELEEAAEQEEFTDYSEST